MRWSSEDFTEQNQPASPSDPSLAVILDWTNKKPHKHHHKHHHHSNGEAESPQPEKTEPQPAPAPQQELDPMLKLLLQVTVMQLVTPRCTPEDLADTWRSNPICKKYHVGKKKFHNAFPGTNINLGFSRYAAVGAVAIAMEKYNLNEDQVRWYCCSF